MNRDYKKAIKRQSILAFLAAFLTIGAFVTYALYEFNVIYLGKKENQISTCSFNISFKDQNPINLVEAYPINDDKIVDYKPYIFSVNTKSNNCTNLKYKITMIDYCNTCELTDGICTLKNNVTANCNSEYKISSSFINYQLVNTRTNEVITGNDPINNLSVVGEIVNGVNETYELKMWIDKDTTSNDLYVYENGSPKENNDGSVVTKNFISKIQVTTENPSLLPNLDTSGANKPELASNMIAVYYDNINDVWRKADSTNLDKTYQWYSYESSGAKKGMWANAVTVSESNRETYKNATPGTTIPMSDINTMWVWIPRFNAVTPSNYNGGTAAAPGAIDVTFVDKTKDAIDAFTFGTESLSGFWYGKFEMTGSIDSLTTKPNITSLRNRTVSSFFNASRAMENSGNIYGFVSSEVDTHMSKNNEWGAVAYLTQSIYGRCASSTSCTEVTINDNSSYMTGAGDYKTNINQSTTGTIYGIYDMSGGSWEYVMGNYNNTISDAGFSGMPEAKYYNLYTGTSYTGHALTETSGWYSDSANFIYSSYPWFRRGGSYSDGTYTGIFYFDLYDGTPHIGFSSRVSLTK